VFDLHDSTFNPINNNINNKLKINVFLISIRFFNIQAKKILNYSASFSFLKDSRKDSALINIAKIYIH